MKPGWQTTEFWLTVIKMALAVAVTAGWIHPGDDKLLGGQITNAVASMAALLASGMAVSKYATSRSEVKKAESYVKEK